MKFSFKSCVSVNVFDQTIQGSLDWRFLNIGRAARIFWLKKTDKRVRTGTLMRNLDHFLRYKKALWKAVKSAFFQFLSSLVLYTGYIQATEHEHVTCSKPINCDCHLSDSIIIHDKIRITQNLTHLHVLDIIGILQTCTMWITFRSTSLHIAFIHVSKAWSLAGLWKCVRARNAHFSSSSVPPTRACVFFTGDSEIEWIIPYNQCNKEVMPLSNGPETDINDIIG